MALCSCLTDFTVVHKLNSELEQASTVQSKVLLVKQTGSIHIPGSLQQSYETLLSPASNFRYPSDVDTTCALLLRKVRILQSPHAARVIGYMAIAQQ